MPSEIPLPIRQALDRFCADARAALGERLESVILFGSLARGEYVPFHSDVNLLVVLKGITLEALDALVEPVHAGLVDMRLSAMIVTAEELAASCDVFPVKIFDMRRHRRVLHGADVLEQLVVARDPLRLRCEQELRNLALRLRRFYVLRARRPEQLRVTLETAVSSLLSGLAVLLQLRGQEPPAARRVVAEVAGRAFGLDVKAVLDVLDLKAGGAQPDEAELRRIYGAFLAVAGRAAEAADRV